MPQSNSQPAPSRRAVLAGLGAMAVTPFPRRPAAAAAAAAAPDPAPFEAILEEHVQPGGDGVNRLAYSALKAGAHAALKDYVGAMEATAVSALPAAERVAFWINLYNAKTLDVVVDHYPVSSIRDIRLGGGLFARGPWKAKIMTVEGSAMSLDDIEHGVLRPWLGDPRIHYALNCAAVGCPDLQRRAWRGATLEAQFEAGARAYVNHPRGLAPGDRFVASQIYRWYRDDYGGWEGLRAHWLRYAEAALQAQLAKAGWPDAYAYDWSLNDAG